MSHVERLFVGGPLDGERIPVEPHTWNYVALRPVRPAYVYVVTDDLDDDRIVYALHTAPTGERVFVAPGAGYDPARFDQQAWVERGFPTVSGWEHLDTWFWRGTYGTRSGPSRNDLWAYVLGDFTDPLRPAAAAHTASTQMIARFRTDMEAEIRRELRHRLDYELLPLCVVPDCTEKAPYEYRAAEAGRLAGRSWKVGDEIRLCPPHSHDVLRAQGMYGVDNLPAWLRPDAKADPVAITDADRMWLLRAYATVGLTAAEAVAQIDQVDLADWSRMLRLEYRADR